MSKIKVSEKFLSVQGEGKFVGAPSVFLRTFGCNLQCRGFGMPKGQLSEERLAIDPKDYKSYTELPLVHTGCDSYPSWDVRFKDFSPMYTVEELHDSLLKLTGSDSWNDTHLVITGGEPLLNWQKQYPDLLELGYEYGLYYVTFETNGTKFLCDELQDYLYTCGQDITFSVSPKLTCSGEKLEETIQPDVIRQYQQYGDTYLKFVVADESDIDEVDSVVKVYREHGFFGNVYLMPVGGTVESYNQHRRLVAELALKRGYYYSPRLHVDLFGNAWAT